MNDAVFVGAMATWLSLFGMVAVGLLGGALMYVCEKIAAKNRSNH